MEKCSDGKRAATVGNLKGTWEPRYVVMSRQGLWWKRLAGGTPAPADAAAAATEPAAGAGAVSFSFGF